MMDSIMHYPITFTAIKRKLIEVIDDIKSCKVRATMLKDNSTTEQFVVFIVFSLIIFGIILFNSVSQADFYSHTFNTLFISLITFIIYCISDYFWYSKNKQYAYEGSLHETEIIKGLLDKTNENLIDANPAEKIESMTRTGSFLAAFFLTTSPANHTVIKTSPR